MKNKNLKIIIIVSIVIPSLILISTVGLNADRNDFPASHFSLETITVGSFPIGISINPITNIVYVANNHSDTVSVIDGKTNLIKDEIKVGDAPTGISLKPKTNMMSKTCSKSVQNMFKKCSKNIQNMCKKCSKHYQKMSVLVS